MAKSSKALQPDDDGFLRTGIYQRYVGKPNPLSFEEFKDYCIRGAESFSKPASERLQEIREELKEIVMPFLEGPLQKDSIDYTKVSKYHCVDFGDGIQVFRELPMEVGNPEAEQFRNALESNA